MHNSCLRRTWQLAPGPPPCHRCPAAAAAQAAWLHRGHTFCIYTVNFCIVATVNQLAVHSKLGGDSRGGRFGEAASCRAGQRCRRSRVERGRALREDPWVWASKAEQCDCTVSWAAGVCTGGRQVLEHSQHRHVSACWRRCCRCISAHRFSGTRRPSGHYPAPNTDLNLPWRPSVLRTRAKSPGPR